MLLITVFAHGEDDNLAWIAMEFIEGSVTLRRKLEELGRQEEAPPGYFADVAVLSRDLTAIPTDEIPTVECLLTIRGGEVVYER